MSEEEAPLTSLFPEKQPKVQPSNSCISYTRPISQEKLSICLAGKHPLWGHHLWNGARWLSDHLELNPSLVLGKSVLELGAGAALPSLLAVMNGADRAVASDYPDTELIDNITQNAALLGDKERERFVAEGFLWGSSPERLLSLNNGKKYDLLFLCDLVFNHSEHLKLLQSCLALISPSGRIWCVFSHYRTWLKDRDLAFLQLASEYFEMELVESKKYDHVIVEDARSDPDEMRTVYAYCLVPRTPICQST